MGAPSSSREIRPHGLDERGHDANSVLLSCEYITPRRLKIIQKRKQLREARRSSSSTTTKDPRRAGASTTTKAHSPLYYIWRNGLSTTTSTTTLGETNLPSSSTSSAAKEKCSEAEKNLQRKEQREGEKNHPSKEEKRSAAEKNLQQKEQREGVKNHPSEENRSEGEKNHLSKKKRKAAKKKLQRIQKRIATEKHLQRKEREQDPISQKKRPWHRVRKPSSLSSRKSPPSTALGDLEEMDPMHGKLEALLDASQFALLAAMDRETYVTTRF